MSYGNDGHADRMSKAGAKSARWQTREDAKRQGRKTRRNADRAIRHNGGRDE